jgi:carbon-monoxide dehydrogenase small subunit
MEIIMNMTSTEIKFVLNGEAVSADVESYETILEVLRNRFDLYGARESCGQGLCGCCTVEIDGRAVTGCIYPAIHADGSDVSTIESLEDGGVLDPVQQAFIECGAFQCGFCTSGFVLMSRQLLRSNSNPTEAEIRNYLSGNLCRCGAYPEIVEAVKLAASRMRARTT